MLNHTSGLPDHSEDPELLNLLQDDPRRTFTPRRLLDFVDQVGRALVAGMGRLRRDGTGGTVQQGGSECEQTTGTSHVRPPDGDAGGRWAPRPCLTGVALRAGRMNADNSVVLPASSWFARLGELRTAAR
ncbi:hypothetical protein ACF08O_25065 [Streptomyces paradoxus]|uniref:hypothetical protein n=1 Tax=Streptomyces paradoxus TaxID=66375 RepID=UPI0036FE35B6